MGVHYFRPSLVKALQHCGKTTRHQFPPADFQRLHSEWRALGEAEQERRLRPFKDEEQQKWDAEQAK